MTIAALIRGESHPVVFKKTLLQTANAPVIHRFEMTSKEDRVRTSYMLACLSFVTSGAIANYDVRAVFGLDQKCKAKASRMIRDTQEANLIKPVDPETAPPD